MRCQSQIPLPSLTQIEFATFCECLIVWTVDKNLERLRDGCSARWSCNFPSNGSCRADSIKIYSRFFAMQKHEQETCFRLNAKILETL